MCHPDVPEGTWEDAATEEVAVPVDEGAAMPGMLAMPAVRPAPAVLVIPDIYGRSPFYENLARRLAASGRVALVVEFFFRQAPLAERTIEQARERRMGLDENRTLRDLEHAVDCLRARADVTGPLVGTVGFCMGGTFVLNLSARRGDLAGVCFYGFPAGGGRPSASPAPLDEVDDVTGPLVGFWGDQDAGVGMDNVARYAAALEERRVDFEHTVYPAVGHGFLAASEFDPEHEAYAAATDAWRQTLAFYDRHLVG